MIRLNLERGPAPGQEFSTFAASPLPRTSATGMVSDPAAAEQPCAVLGHATPAMGWQTHAYQDVDEFMSMLGGDLRMMGPGSATYQGDESAAPLPDADLESTAGWDQAETELNSRATAFDMMSKPSAVSHYECDRIMLGLLESLSHSNPQCQPAAKVAPENLTSSRRQELVKQPVHEVEPRSAPAPGLPLDSPLSSCMSNQA